MGRKRYLKIFLPLLFILIIASVTSCFMFFMDWIGGLEGDWKYRNTAINETVFLTIKKNSIEMIFDEDNPNYPMTPLYFSASPVYFNDWGFKANLFVDEDINQMDININKLYRYYSKWYQYYRGYSPYWDSINKERSGGGGFFDMIAWPWNTSPFTNYFYNAFMSNYPGVNLNAAGNNIICDYILDGDKLTLIFDPGGLNTTYIFNRQ